MEERLKEIQEARENLLNGNPFDAIQIILRRMPYWDGNGMIDVDWFLRQLDEEEKFIKKCYGGKRRIFSKMSNETINF